MHQNSFIPGDIVIGKVIKIEKDCAWIDIGLDNLAYIHISQMWNRPNYKINYPKDILFINQIRDFEIFPDYDNKKLICLSVRTIYHRIIAKRLQQIEKENITIFAPIDRIVTAGAIVDIEELLGFIPPFLLGSNLNDKIIGKILPLKILNLQIDKNLHLVNNFCDFTLIHDCPEIRNRIDEFSVGKIVSCQIKCIKKYGLIVTINNTNNFRLSGLIRIDNISIYPTENLNSLFKIGQTIKAVIIKVDAKMRGFYLSTKLLE